MDTKLIEDFEIELAAHAAALERAAELCEAQDARIKELEAENSEAADHIGRAEMAEQAMKVRRSELEDLTRELSATKKTLGTLIVWLQVDLGIENVERLLAMMSESQREAAGTADETPDGQAENARDLAPPPQTPANHE